MPVGIDFDVDYHLLAHKALWHLLEQISARESLSVADRHIGEFLSHYFRAWAAAMPVLAPTSAAFAVRGVRSLLDAVRGNTTMPDEYLGLADALGQFVRQWGREMHDMAQAQLDTTPGPAPVEKT